MVLLLLTPIPGHAAAIFETHLPDGTWKVTIEGEIIPRDYSKFFNVVRYVEKEEHGIVSSIHFNSPGGLIYEGLSIGRFIKKRKFMTIIESDHHCEPICFFMFMYGDRKLIGRNAKLGIHGASQNGKNAPDATWELYEKEMNFFIPEYLGRGINGIPSSEMYYLTRDDLAAMGFDCTGAMCKSDVLN
jgi:hypothetical protein